MQTVLMGVAVVRRGDRLLLRKVDPARNPYKEPWALFGGRLDGEGEIETLLNQELTARWRMSVSIIERLWWDEDKKADHDGITKRFVYLDVLCELTPTSNPHPANPHEELAWVELGDLTSYELNPPTLILLKKLGCL
jgi:ADP-ribose pyrophosphatase YjhB (NUDIX family)